MIRILNPLFINWSSPFSVRSPASRSLRSWPCVRVPGREVRPDYGLGWKKEGKCAEAIGAGWTRESRWERSEVLLGELREGVMYEKA